MELISIVICTKNRAWRLRETLASVLRSTSSAHYESEIIVVDNGSTDSTGQVVAELACDKCRISYVKEMSHGKGYAYNTGIALAQGDIIIFTDDDVIVPVDWVDVMSGPIRRGTADAVAGGIVFPPELGIELESRRLAGIRTWFASSAELSPEAPENLIGANMAIGRHVIEKVPAFDVELGPGRLGFGEETMFSYQLLTAGFRLVSAFESPVEHRFDVSRLTRKSLLQMAQRMGCSQAYIRYHWKHDEPLLPALSGLRRWVGLNVRRLKHLNQIWYAHEVPLWELTRVSEQSFANALRHEQSRPRNYAKRGLVKISGEGATGGECS